MRKYVVTLIHKPTLSGFSCGFGNLIYDDLESDSYITDKDFYELQKTYEEQNFYILSITDVTGEK